MQLISIKILHIFLVLLGLSNSYSWVTQNFIHWPYLKENNAHTSLKSPWFSLILFFSCTSNRHSRVKVFCVPPVFLLFFLVFSPTYLLLSMNDPWGARSPQCVLIIQMLGHLMYHTKCVKWWQLLHYTFYLPMPALNDW